MILKWSQRYSLYTGTLAVVFSVLKYACSFVLLLSLRRSGAPTTTPHLPTPTPPPRHPHIFLQSDFLSPINVPLFFSSTVTESPVLFPVVKPVAWLQPREGF